MFSGKNPIMNAENEVSMTCYNPQHRGMTLAPAQFHCSFRIFIA